MKRSHPSIQDGAFSLVELLVVIAVIAIIAAIAIPNLASVTQSADSAKDQRNAQNIASVYAAAIAANAQATQSSLESSSLDTAIQALRTSVTGNLGVLTQSTFQIDAISDGDVTNASSFLEMRTNGSGDWRMHYVEDGAP